MYLERVMESFINENPKTYCSLVKAMIKACQYCSDTKNREEVAKIISNRYLRSATLCDRDRAKTNEKINILLL